MTRYSSGADCESSAHVSVVASRAVVVRVRSPRWAGVKSACTWYDPEARRARCKRLTKSGLSGYGHAGDGRLALRRQGLANVGSMVATERDLLRRHGLYHTLSELCSPTHLVVNIVRVLVEGEVL